MITPEKLAEIIANTKCGVGNVDWKIHHAPMGDGFFIQLRYVEADIETGNLEDQHGRKWYVSKHSTESEVVQTILKACLTSAEHIIREHFIYKNVRVFGPHLNINQLVELGSAGAMALDVRPIHSTPTPEPMDEHDR